jgi:hypothetical protein
VTGPAETAQTNFRNFRKRYANQGPHSAAWRMLSAAASSRAAMSSTTFRSFRKRYANQGPQSAAHALPGGIEPRRHIVDGAAGDAEEAGLHLVGGAEQAIVMGEFAVLGFVERRLSGAGHLSNLSSECRQG